MYAYYTTFFRIYLAIKSFFFSSNQFVDELYFWGFVFIYEMDLFTCFIQFIERKIYCWISEHKLLSIIYLKLFNNEANQANCCIYYQHFTLVDVIETKIKIKLARKYWVRKRQGKDQKCDAIQSSQLKNKKRMKCYVPQDDSRIESWNIKQILYYLLIDPCWWFDSVEGKYIYCEIS